MRRNELYSVGHKVLNSSFPPSLLQRLVEAAEEAHLQHDEDPDLQVLASPAMTTGSEHTDIIVVTIVVS